MRQLLQLVMPDSNKLSMAFKLRKLFRLVTINFLCARGAGYVITFSVCLSDRNQLF